MDAQLEVHPPTVARSSVGMAAVARQLQAIKDVLDHHCTLSSTAFGAVGEDEVRRYNDRCHDVSAQVAGLLTKAEDYSQHLAHNAVAYVTTEDANVEAALHAFDTAPTPADGAPNEVAANVGLGAVVIGGMALTSTPAGALKDRLIAALRLAQEAKKDEVTSILSQEIFSSSRQGVVYAGTSAMVKADRLAASAVGRLSSIARLSQATDTALALGGRWSITALAAAVMWTSNLLCPSDYQVDITVNAWTQIAKAARSIFDDEVDGIARQLFADWTDRSAWGGTASAAAKTAFAEFQTSGRALADHAERMATSLTTLVQGLDALHQYAFYFASGQLVALIAYATLACFPTPAAGVAKVAVEIIGQVLRKAVSVWGTIVSSLLGMLIQVVGTLETVVPGDPSWAKA